MTAREAAPAKINLCLHVTGQRADGYHLLDSVVAFAGAGDVVAARQAPALTLELTGPEAAGLDVGEGNLVLRAARAMGVVEVALTLDKHLPHAAGLGGGSSDAAATLRLLARLTGRPMPGADMQLALGADVPVCMDPRPQRLRGIGERLDPLPSLPPCAVVLVNPRVALSTPRVFAALGSRTNPPLTAPPGWTDFTTLCDWLRAQRNDLEDPARALAPPVAMALDALRARPGCALARMSGSGATCFGLFSTRAEAQDAVRALHAAQPSWWVVSSDLLT